VADKAQPPALQHWPGWDKLDKDVLFEMVRWMAQ
jgi:hypothetical protein